MLVEITQDGDFFKNFITKFTSDDGLSTFFVSTPESDLREAWERYACEIMDAIDAVSGELNDDEDSGFKRGD